jgi:hypothetical protein
MKSQAQQHDEAVTRERRRDTILAALRVWREIISTSHGLVDVMGVDDAAALWMAASQTGRPLTPREIDELIQRIET